jgi:hypothetical protein
MASDSGTVELRGLTDEMPEIGPAEDWSDPKMKLGAVYSRTPKPSKLPSTLERFRNLSQHCNDYGVLRQVESGL